MALEEAAPQPAADEEARGVAEDRAEPDQPDQRNQLDLALAGDHAAGDHHGLARRHQADERAGLEEGQHAHEHVGPRAERLGDVADHLLRVGQRGEHAARVDRRRRAPAPAASSLRSPLRLAATPDDERRDRDSAATAATICPTDTPADVGEPRRAPQGCRSSATIAPSIPAAAPAAAPRSAKSPKQVGPDPLTSAASGAGPRRSVEHLGQLGPQRQRGGLEVVLERAGRAAGGASRRAHAAVADRAARASPASDRAPRRRVPWTGPRAAAPERRRRAAAARPASTSSPTPWTSAWRGSTWLGTSEPRPAAISRSGVGVERAPGDSVGGAEHRGGVGAAAAEAGGYGDPLVDPHVQTAGARARCAERRRPPRRRGWLRPPRDNRPSRTSPLARRLDLHARRPDPAMRRRSRAGAGRLARGRPTCRTRLSLAKARSLMTSFTGSPRPRAISSSRPRRLGQARPFLGGKPLGASVGGQAERRERFADGRPQAVSGPGGERE